MTDTPIHPLERRRAQTVDDLYELLWTNHPQPVPHLQAHDHLAQHHPDLNWKTIDATINDARHHGLITMKGRHTKTRDIRTLALTPIGHAILQAIHPDTPAWLSGHLELPLGNQTTIYANMHDHR